ncbi:Endo-1,4-beta-xylanase Z [Paraconexibacter sp. AEG42_29]|uniref:Beta-xylanase n=1 Tax=Paraconexibacter sp. AEG42_29 TaxID=2997339 RepID=A0AAU7B3A6_9ACTN
MRRWIRRLLVVAGVLFVFVLLGALASHRDNLEGPSAKPLPGPTLRASGKANDILIGTAVDDGALRNEPGYRTDLAAQFSVITPENAMKWDALEPERGKLQWAAADRAVDFASDRRIAVRGHTLVWHSQVPAWIADGKLPAAELRQVMLDHISRTMRRYKGRVKTWDVVNEVIGDDGKLRPSVWSDALGSTFIFDAFAAARKADPDARLAINEIGGESIGPKSDTLLRVVKRLKARGLVDEVGFQSHFNLDGDPAGVPDTMKANMERFAAAGVDVAITEFDVSLKEPASDDQLAQQAGVYAELATTCRAVPRCRSITVWGFTDRHSWIPESSPGYGSATLLDDELKPKPAFLAFSRALRAGG